MSAEPAVESLLIDELIAHPEASAEQLIELVRSGAPLLSLGDVKRSVERALRRAQGLGAIAPLFSDPAISEIMINGPGPVWIDRTGALTKTPIELSGEEIGVLIERMLGPLGLHADRTAPLVDARLADGSRVNVAMPPLAIDGPAVTIRRFHSTRLGLDAFGDGDVTCLLRRLVEARASMVVVGGTGAGKTSLLNALAEFVPPTERVVTVEDTAELQLPGAHVVRLECRPANSEGIGEFTMRDLVRNALRMRPDRIVVGETRGAETLDLIMALNTGHDGSLATCHANGAEAAVLRLETLAQLGGVAIPSSVIRRQLWAGLDVVVHLVKTPAGRRVQSIGELAPVALVEPSERFELTELWPERGTAQRERVRRAIDAAGAAS